MKWLLVVALVVVGCTRKPSPPTQAQLKLQAHANELKSWVLEAQKRSLLIGASVALIDSEGNVIKGHYGYHDRENKIPPNDRTGYELGSITKTVTRLLLADQDRVKMKDPLSKYLPSNVAAPLPGGKEIRIQDLALHTGFKAGFPCVSPGDVETCFGVDKELSFWDPFKNVKQGHLYQFIGAYSDWVKVEPTKFTEPGTEFNYSNVGSAILGDILTGPNYQQVVREKILKPLGMSDSGFSEIPTVVYDWKENRGWGRANPWTLSAFDPAGGLRASLDDSIKYVKAQMGLLDSPLKRAIKRSHEAIPDAGEDQYFGWPSADTIFYHGGATGGSMTMIMFSHDLKFGLVILTNSRKDDKNLPNDFGACLMDKAGFLKGDVKKATQKLCDSFWVAE